MVLNIGTKKAQMAGVNPSGETNQIGTRAAFRKMNPAGETVRHWHIGSFMKTSR